jgi:Bacterial inner membrane protein
MAKGELSRSRVLTTGLWLVYDFANGSLGGVLAELISAATLLTTIWRMKPTPADEGAV